jgi:hypothetical protein
MQTDAGIILMTDFVGMACVPAPSEHQAAPAAAELAACKEPRPQICTAHYDPVCGLSADGNYKTYANACSACSDKAVSGHRPGACE